ncbi:MAG: VOC family protein [Syntrophaceticus sp.]|nr:VOC family protein [Syntrophaceticus sp.]
MIGMEFNGLIPELTVSDIDKSKKFYVDILGFKIEYERLEDKFVFLSLDTSQIMLEQYHNDGWNIGDLVYPFGRGINFSIEVEDIEKLYLSLTVNDYPLYRPMMNNSYRVNDNLIEQKELLVQDPDGYLLRFTYE